ncbi:hypothetical protein ACFYVG_39270, partial [Streptomyces spiralis]
RVVLHRHRRSSRFLRIKQIQYQRVHHSGGGPVRRHSPDGVSLHVFQQNTDARAFYESHGFTVLDTNDGERNMENLPDMTLRWTPNSVQ